MSIFSAPTPFSEALDFARRRSLLPTHLGTAELRQLAADVRRRSVFSARTTNATYLQKLKDGVEELLEGNVNEATIRARLQQLLAELGYDPARGFADDRAVPPSEAGSLRDLSSDRRIKLILDTQESMAANFGYRLQGQSDLSRAQFPCLELVRVRTVESERGNWPERWVRSGGQLFDGRMIARKDDPVWDNLGSSALFEDGLDNPYPPFAFNSGMGVREVPRDECEALGVIKPGETPTLEDPQLNAELKLAADQFDPEFLAALDADLSIEITRGEVRPQLN